MRKIIHIKYPNKYKSTPLGANGRRSNEMNFISGPICKQIFVRGHEKDKSSNNRITPDTITLPFYPETDLKYMKQRDIDIEVLKKLNKDVPELFQENKDTVKYRIKDCIKDGGFFLDLNNLNLNKLPKTPQRVLDYKLQSNCDSGRKNKILSGNMPLSIRHLFISNNRLTNIDELSKLHNLETLDCSNNKLKKLPKLSETLKELSCQNNDLTNLDNLLLCNGNINIIRLDCSYNIINNIPRLFKLISLNCRNNLLGSLPNLPNLKNLKCQYNKLKLLGRYPDLEHMECNDNVLTKIENFPKLLNLYCESNRINKLNNMDSIIMLYCYNNKLSKIPYFKTVDTITCDYNDMTKISSKYKVKSQFINKDCVRYNFSYKRMGKFPV